ncbi:MAG: thiamine ABC transporter substrate-binding protein, partial [Actinomycetota bacterium]
DDDSAADDVTEVEAGATDDESADTDDGGDDATDDGSDDADTGEAETDGAETDDGPVAIEADATIRLLTHDSFVTTDGVFDAFTAETGFAVEVVNGGDAGELVARAVLSADDPEGDVLFGVDNTFLQRALDAGIFEAHESAGLDVVPDELELDPEFRVTPIDFGDVCVNYWIDQVDEVPSSLDDLTDPAFASSFVTQDPETSSPGFAFLLATIARYGEDGWEDYWTQLRDGGVTVTPGWSDAYYGEFAAGGGDKALVNSYGSSPVAEVLFSEEPIEEPPTGVLTDSCFRQIEFAGVLAGTEQSEAAAALVDFMLSDTFQAQIPLTMFVRPANSEVVLPDLYQAHAAAVDEPLILDPATIEANRNDWTERWAEIVLR